MRRTFIDYYKEYGNDLFSEYGEAFVNWTKFSGYIPTIFTNHVYSFAENELKTTNELLYERSFENNDIHTKTKEILGEINTVGYQTEIYQDNKELFKNREDELESSFSARFLEILFPEATFNPDLKKTNPENICLKFKKILHGNMMRDRVALLDNFIEDFKLFLTNIPNCDIEEFGFFEIEDINHDFRDIGILIYSKSYLSERILFYQIGDNN
ncbi:hypothetical protein ACFSTE_04970 [Aquimarina hainanensis]|uniref:Uncharacterized protein n=1 Tax=Aquimarina hainanensis TaxID=1578017 RepID=A0ABW5N5A6_9FLAO|nr:hypothetical protein [Aquimarina sp. TRL1]QKX06173.1 hypothetical protein HN014_15065 [Aquimarina sp. TRL1]